MGAILAVEEVAIRRHVAMKVMLSGAELEARARFVEEGQITGQLEHPNIVPVHELGVNEEGEPYYTMKLVRGKSLRQVLDRLEAGDQETAQAYPLAQLLTIFQKVCDAVAFAHSRGVIHRDLKPENVMLGDFGEVLVMDWGLAKILGQAESPHSACSITAGDSGGASVTMAGTVMGTPQYMAPEQARGEIATLDARSDVYSLGAMLFHLLALRPPVQGNDPWKVVERVATGQHDPLPAVRRADSPGKSEAIAGSLAAVVRQAMAFLPEVRYQQVAELQHDVAAYQNGFATRAEQAGLGKQLALLLRRHRGMAGSIAVALVLLALVAGTAFWRVTGEKNRAERALSELQKTAPTFYEQAIVLTARADLGEALGKIETALTLHPGESRFELQRGHILQTMERFADAHAAYAEALRHDPGNRLARENVELSSRLLEAKSQPGGSLSDFERLRWRDALVAQGRSAEALLVGHGLHGETIVLQKAWQGRLTEWLGAAAPQITLKPQTGTFELDLSDRSISDLSPLRGMPLTGLKLENVRRVHDLSPLRVLAFPFTKVKDLSPLAEMTTLETLNLGNTDVVDLQPLAGLRLKSLSAYGGGTVDLAPLRGQPLAIVSLNGKRFPSLAPLADSPLVSLSIEDCHHVDLLPLAKVRLERLYAANTTVDHLEILAEMTSLTDITLPRNLSDPGRLRQLPHLQRIGHHRKTVSGGESTLEDAATFWREYDAGKQEH